MNLKVNYGFWVIMYQGRLINCNKSATLVEDVDNGGSHACVGTGGTWAISVPLNFAVKTVLGKS